MSNITQRNTTQSGPGSTRRGGGPGAVIRKTPVRPKLDPKDNSGFSFRSQADLKDAFVIVIGGDSGTRSITYHHPIGVTNLDVDDWVASETSDVTLLLSRKDNPFLKEYDLKVHESCLKAAAAAGLIQLGEGMSIRYPNGVPRAPVLKAAKLALKADKSPGNITGDSYIRYIVDETSRVAEQAFISAIRDEGLREAAKRKFVLPSFETKGGIDSTKAQCAIPNFKGLGPAQVMDSITRGVLALPIADERVTRRLGGTTMTA